MEEFSAKNIIKAILALLFVGCLADWEYGYYQLVRFTGMVGFIVLASFDKENKQMQILWISSAILINPIFKIGLGRTTWNIVDIIWAIILVVSIFIEKKINQEGESNTNRI